MKKLLSLWAQAGANTAIPPTAVRPVTTCTQKRFIGRTSRLSTRKGASASQVTRGCPVQRDAGRTMPIEKSSGLWRQGQIDGELDYDTQAKAASRSDSSKRRCTRASPSRVTTGQR